MKNLHFIAPLWNAHGAIDKVVLRHGLRIEKRPAKSVFRTLKQLDDLGEAHEWEFAGEPETSPGGGRIFVVTGRLGRSNGTAALPKSVDGLMEEGRWQAAFARRFEDQFAIMRLFKEGRLFSPGWYLYRYEDREVIPESSSTNPHRPEGEPYRLTAEEARALSTFLSACSIPFRHDYLNLAFEHFLQSYESPDVRMSFLSLMIAAEVLLNDGRGELGYRLARGMAVLAGTDENTAWNTFRQVKKLYDKRSGLVHSGVAKGLSLADMVSLRELVRTSLTAAIRMELPKDRLVERVTASGFASRGTPGVH